MTIIEPAARTLETRPGGGRTPAPQAVRRWDRLPYVVSRLFFVAAAILALQALFPAIPLFGTLVDAMSTLFVPIDSGTIGFAAFAVILEIGRAHV